MRLSVVWLLLVAGLTGIDGSINFLEIEKKSIKMKKARDRARVCETGSTFYKNLSRSNTGKKRGKRK